jgi:4-alpha-glucanotransferase
MLKRKQRDVAGVFAALLRWLGEGPAEMVLVNLEDLWLEAQPQNVPGTGEERPNWCRKAARSFEQFSRDKDVNALLDVLNAGRRSN